MDRRSVLKRVGGLSGAVAVAGCSVQEDGGSDGSGGSDGGSGTDADGSTEAAGGTGTAWYSLAESELAIREEVLSAYNEQSANTIEGSDLSDLQQKTRSAIPAGEGPHVFDWAHDWAGNIYEQGFVVDQSDQVSVGLDQFSEVARNAVQYEGNLVGLPYGAETITPIVNTDIVDSTPETVDEMVSMIEEYHDPDNGVYGLSYPFADGYFTSPWLHAFGGHIFDPSADEPLGVNHSETVRGLEFMLDNFVPYMPNDPTYNPQAAAFNEGNAAFAINGPWSLATYNDNDLNYEVISYPEMSDGTPRPYTGIQVWYFAAAMGDGGDDAAAARDFVEWYVTNEDHLRQLAEDLGSIPVLSSLVGSSDLPDQVQAFSESVDQGRPMPSAPRMDGVWEPVKSALTRAFNGDQSAQEAMDAAADQIRSNWEG